MSCPFPLSPGLELKNPGLWSVLATPVLSLWGLSGDPSTLWKPPPQHGSLPGASRGFGPKGCGGGAWGLGDP